MLLAEYTGRKNYAKIECTIAQLCRAISSQLRYVSTVGKKLVKQQYLLYIMVNVGPLTAEIGWRVLGTPANFSGFRLGFVTAPTSLNGGQPNFARCVAVSCAGTLYILGALVS